MKLLKAELERFLKAPPQSLCGVLLYGKDRSKVIETGTSIAKKVVPDLNDPFSVAHLTDSDIDNDPARLEDELSAQSLMGGKRLIILKFFSEKAALEKIVAEAIKAHSDGKLNPDAFIIIEAGGLGGDSTLRRASESSKTFGTIAIYDDEIGDIVRLARETLKDNQVALNPAAMEIFSQRMPKEKGVALQEIERLCLYIGPGSGKTLNEVELQEFLGVEPDASLFTAALDAFGGRMKAAQSGLRRAFAEGEGSIAALRALSHHYQKLRLFKSLVETQSPIKEASKAAGIFWKDENEFSRQARQWGFKHLDTIMDDMIDTDIQCKTTGMPDLLLAERLFLQIAGRANRLGL